MLEMKEALMIEAGNSKIPVLVLMSFSDIKYKIQPLLDSYAEAKRELEKRLSEKKEDNEGNIVDWIPPENMVEYRDQDRALLAKQYKVKLPVIKASDLGYDPKKPTSNKFEIKPGFVMGMGKLIVKK